MAFPGDQRDAEARTHVFRHQVVVPAERRLLTPLVAPGTRALDVGCAATGRSARLLRGRPRPFLWARAAIPQPYLTFERLSR